MFFEKATVHRARRKYKKANRNKDRRRKERYDGNYMTNGIDKLIQLKLREEGILVHKTDLRSIRVAREDYDYPVGNSTQRVVRERYRHYSELLSGTAEGFYSHSVHDVSKWRSSIRKSKQRKRERKDGARDKRSGLI
jgi:hypothetical protein